MRAFPHSPMPVPRLLREGMVPIKIGTRGIYLSPPPRNVVSPKQGVPLLRRTSQTKFLKRSSWNEEEVSGFRPNKLELNWEPGIGMFKTLVFNFDHSDLFRISCLPQIQRYSCFVFLLFVMPVCFYRASRKRGWVVALNIAHNKWGRAPLSGSFEGMEPWNDLAFKPWLPSLEKWFSSHNFYHSYQKMHTLKSEWSWFLQYALFLDDPDLCNFSLLGKRLDISFLSLYLI